MGIRIRRHLGYALTDFEGEPDPRVNTDKFENRWDLCDDYVDFAIEDTDQAVEILENELGLESYRARFWSEDIRRHEDVPQYKCPDPITYDPEHGMENVLLFQPVHKTDWYRFDEKVEPLVKDSQLLTHLKEDWYTHIPPDIRLFAYWSGIFEDFNTVYTLKPVLYTYWS